MIGLDTNVLLRYLAQDDAEQARVATRFVELSLSAVRPGHVSLVCLAELVWVLRRSLDATIEETATVLSQLFNDERFRVQEQAAAWVALDLYRIGSCDYADALIAALDRRQGCSHTVTFDKAAAKQVGMKLLV